MPSYFPPKKNTAYVLYVSLVSQANTKIMQANPTLAAGDVKVATDDAVPANLATLPVVDADFTKRVKVSLSASEMNGDRVTIVFSDAAGAEWCDLTADLATVTNQLDDLATQASVNTIDDFLDTEIAAIKAKTDGLPTDPADASDIATLFTTVNTKLDTIDDFLDTEIAAIKAKTDGLPTDPADASDIATATIAIAGYIDTEVAAILAAVDTEVAAIKAKTDNLPTDPADDSDIDAQLTAITGYLDTEVASILAAVDTEIAAVKTVTDALTAAAAAKLALSAGTIVTGAAIAGTLSTTAMTTNLTEATDDHYNGRIMIWTSGALANQATDITDYNGATKLLTFTAVTEAPGAADTFIIV